MTEAVLAISSKGKLSLREATPNALALVYKSIDKDFCACSRSMWLWFCDRSEKAYYALEECFIDPLRLGELEPHPGDSDLSDELLSRVLENLGERLSVEELGRDWWSNGLVVVLRADDGAKRLFIAGNSFEFGGDSHLNVEAIATVENHEAALSDIRSFRYDVAGLEMLEWPLIAIVVFVLGVTLWILRTLIEILFLAVRRLLTRC